LKGLEKQDSAILEAAGGMPHIALSELEAALSSLPRRNALIYSLKAMLGNPVDSGTPHSDVMQAGSVLWHALCKIGESTVSLKELFPPPYTALGALLESSLTCTGGSRNFLELNAWLIAVDRLWDSLPERASEYSVGMLSRVVADRFSGGVCGFDADAVDLHVCYDSGLIEIMRLLLRAGASFDAVQGGKRITERIVEEDNGNKGLWMLRLLLEHGADPNTRSASTGSLLYRAVGRGIDSLSQLLLKHGAHPGLVGPCGGTSLHAAVRGGTHTCVEACLESILGSDSPEALDLQDDKGDSAMHIAARQGDQYLVGILHEAGADPELRNRARETPTSLFALVSESLERQAAEAEAEAECRNRDSVVGQWSASHVVAWVWSMRFGKTDSAAYARLFAEASVDGGDLIYMTDADLSIKEEGGIGKPSTRVRDS